MTWELLGFSLGLDMPEVEGVCSCVMFWGLRPFVSVVSGVFWAFSSLRCFLYHSKSLLCVVLSFEISVALKYTGQSLLVGMWGPWHWKQ